MKHDQLMNMVVHNQVADVQVLKRGSVQYTILEPLPSYAGPARSVLKGTYFFVDNSLTDCQSYSLSGGDWIRYARDFEKGCELVSVNMNRDMIDHKEVRT